MSDAPKMKGGVIKRGTTWSYVVTELDGATGKRRQRWVGGFPTQKAAKDARATALHKQATGSYTEPTKITVKEFCEQWLEVQANRLKPSTVFSYRKTLDTYLFPKLGAVRLQQLGPQHLDPFYAAMLTEGGRGDKPRSPTTVKYVHRVLSSAMTAAVKQGLITANPCKRATLPTREAGDAGDRLRKERLEAWSAEEARTFLAAIVGHPLHPFYALALATGMRRGELLALRWGNVDLDAAELHVREAYVPVDGTLRLTTPKDHEERTITLDADTVAILRDVKPTTPTGGTVTEIDSRRQLADRLVFARKGTNEPLRGDWVSKAIRTLAADAGVPPIKLHGLRHTHATLLQRWGVASGASLRGVGNRCGWGAGGFGGGQPEWQCAAGNARGAARPTLLMR
jgi:integrase